MPSTNLIIFCQEFYIKDNHIIDLSGENEKNINKFNDDEKYGKDGLPGRPGKTSGHFLLVNRKISRKLQLN